MAKKRSSSKSSEFSGYQKQKKRRREILFGSFLMLIGFLFLVSFLPASTTVAPASPMALAIAKPIPPFPPVIIATLSIKLNNFIFYHLRFFLTNSLEKFLSLIQMSMHLYFDYIKTYKHL